MKFDVVLTNMPFRDDKGWVMPKYIRVHVDLVEEQGYYAGIMTKWIMLNDRTFDTKFTRLYQKRLNKSFDFGNARLWYYIWQA